MKKPVALLVLMIVWLGGILLTPSGKAFLSSLEKEQEYEHEEEEEKETGIDKQLQSWFQARAYPDPYYLNDKFLKGWQQAQALKKMNDDRNRNSRILSSTWISIGPNNSIGGRILSIAIDPNNSNNLMVGSASGGIWKSVNAGSSWSSVKTGLPVLGVPAITYHPTNSNIIIAGTGEVYRIDTSNIGFNVWKARGTYGTGIIRSTNGGATWTNVFNKTFPDLFGVQKIKFDPNNSSIVYACTTQGMFKSTDEGATWSTTPVLSKIYVSDLAINPSNSNIMVAAVGNLVNSDKGIYRTVDGGATWTKVTTGGFPTGMMGYTTFGYINSSLLYASVGMTDNGENELYMSTDFGQNWIAKSGSHHSQYQFWCAHAIAVNPTNANEIIMGGVSYYRYTSTSTSSSTGSAAALSSSIHSDVHDIEYVQGSGTTFYIACDGGVYKTTNNGSTFSAMNTGLGAVQFYASIGVSTNSSNPNAIVGGLQDNGVWYYNGTSWTKQLGGDGGSCIITPGNDNVVLACNDALTVNKSTTGASGTFSKVLGSWAFVADDRTAFMAPIGISKSDPTRMYAASDNLHVSSSSGSSWTNASYSTASQYIDAKYKTAITLAVSPTNKDKLYISTSPFSQKTDNTLNINGTPGVFRCINGGAATPVFTSIKTGLPDRFVMDFAINPTNDNIVFAVVGGYGTPHIYYTSDGGNTWAARGAFGILPDVPFNAIYIDPVNPNYVYAGSDLGVYVSPDQGLNWYDFSNGLPDVTQVMDIQMTPDNQMLIATHGRGAFRSAKASGALPVNIISFTGAALNASNRLEWQVSEQLNIVQYEIERSADGTTFQKIGSVYVNNAGYNTMPNTVYTLSYNYTDADVANRTYYYRLRAIDNTGGFTYSGVALVRRYNQQKIEILGNPFRTEVKMNIMLTQSKNVQVGMYDIAGRLIYMQQKKLNSGLNSYEIPDLDLLPKGMYQLEVIIDEQRWSQKVLKQ